MTLAERLQAFVALGSYLKNLLPEELERITRLAHSKNGWFTPANVRFALNAWAEQLEEAQLRKWLSHYTIPDQQPSPKKVGVVMAGNIPLVGFHDLLCVLLSGHILHGKLSSTDVLPDILSKKLLELEPRFADAIQYSEQLKGMDAYIATGSDNTARYFEYYFRNLPHIIRKNRNSCAILTGKETEEELKSLGRDMFQYWGLGCRSVNKLYVPNDYNFATFFDSLEPWADLQHHHKWVNNYDYHKSIYLVNGDAHLDNGFLLLIESEAMSSPASVAYYEKYQDLQELEQKLEKHSGGIQCIVGGADVPATTAFGQAQRPQLWDYADGIDTMEFLLNL